MLLEGTKPRMVLPGSRNSRKIVCHGPGGERAAAGEESMMGQFRRYSCNFSAKKLMLAI